MSSCLVSIKKQGQRFNRPTDIVPGESGVSHECVSDGFRPRELFTALCSGDVLKPSSWLG